jgi:ubiquinone/menaquinone biosynthesis C-methylase UbiE
LLIVALVNENHVKMCSSPEWAEMLQTELLASLGQGVELGGEMLEVGPGPGAATDWLRRKVGRLVAIEIDPPAAQLLATKFAGTNVEVVVGDATAMEFPDASFDSVGCFTMLHHVPGAAGQAKVLSEMSRVLRPGGVLVVLDGLPSTESHNFHAGDTYNPIEPSYLLAIVRSLGFAKITLDLDRRLRLVARRPAPEPTGDGEPLAGGLASSTTAAKSASES